MVDAVTVSRFDIRHRIRVGKADAAEVQGVAARIEAKLGVACDVSYQGDDFGWAIDWIGPEHPDLSFLQPYILPPKRPA